MQFVFILLTVLATIYFNQIDSSSPLSYVRADEIELISAVADVAKGLQMVIKRLIDNVTKPVDLQHEIN